jgi:ribonuclease HII
MLIIDTKVKSIRFFRSHEKDQTSKEFLMIEIIAGVDEVGVSPIAGPVVAAAVILNPKHKVYKLRDSKILSREQREALYAKIIERALDYSIGVATVREIDRINIFHATMLAMERAIRGLSLSPHLILIDGRALPKIDFNMKAIVGGDKKVKVISAASIVAKVIRDRMMEDFHGDFPHYHFNNHKGYPTKEHQAKLQTHGVCPIHRRSYARVKDRLNV